MNIAVGKPASRPKADRVPLEVYGSLVDALHEIAASLFIGAASATIAALITAWQASSLVLLGFAIAVAIASALRVLDMRAYRRARPALRSAESLKRWERRYIAYSAVYVGLLGSWCLACFIISDDPFIRLFAFATVLAYLIGVSGRNFASSTLVMSQILMGGIPLSLSLIYVGGLYWAVLVLVIVPFLASIKMIADRLRQQLLDAVISARDITQLAARFTTALNNMPHGLIMFDVDRHLVVANERLVELLGIAHEDVLSGKTPRELWAGSADLRATNEFDRFAAEFERKLSGAQGETNVRLGADRWLSFTTRPMDNGGSVVIVEDITERRTAEQRINRLAKFDGLTKLPNRYSFHEMLSRALATAGEEEAIAVMFVDLDEFKQVNDTLGHPAGDQLLATVAERLRRLLTPPDAVARFGGDEFVVMLRIAGHPAGYAETVAQTILDVVSQPYDLGGQSVIIGASVGIATAPRDGSDPDLLLKNADMALYHAKANGRRGWRMFDPEMDAEAHAKRALELDLRKALGENQFELYYQPLLNLRSGQIRTCEALIRWNHPTRGMVSPAHFIPLAEDIGIIKEIGDWVIETACRECVTWPGGVAVAVNLSSVQFRNPGLTRVIADALASSGLAPHRLEVEITESVLLKDTPAVRAILEELVGMGVRIALDDFGTGYSGLSYLHTFPLHKVKIDRSFVTQLHSGDRSLTLLKGVARLSATLGLKVVVEGIETPEQLDVITAEDSVDEVQGYLFSMPLPASQIRQLISSHAPGGELPSAAAHAAGKRRRTEAA